MAEPDPAGDVETVSPDVSLAFYRKHTEKMLRRYLYASMLVGRAPAILGEPIGRGWVSSRKVKTFEDAVIFVLDIERCLKKLGHVDQRDSQPDRAAGVHTGRNSCMLGVSVRAISYKYKRALDASRNCCCIRASYSSAFIIAGPRSSKKGSAELRSPFSCRA